MFYIKVVKRETLRVYITRKKKLFFFLKKMFTKPTVVIMMYLSQIIVLYTLNLQGAVCYLYLNKTGSKESILSYLFYFQWLDYGTAL